MISVFERFINTISNSSFLEFSLVVKGPEVILTFDQVQIDYPAIYSNPQPYLTNYYLSSNGYLLLMTIVCIFAGYKITDYFEYKRYVDHLGSIDSRFLD